VQAERWSGFYAGAGVGLHTGGSRGRIDFGQAPVGEGFQGNVFTGPAYFAAQDQYQQLLAACDALTGDCVASGFNVTQNALGAGNFSRRNSFIGSLNAGYNWQAGNLVFGLEADVSILGSRSRASWRQDSAGAFLIEGAGETNGGGGGDPVPVTGPNAASVIGQSNVWLSRGFECGEPALNPNATGNNNQYIATCSPGGENGGSITFTGIGAYEASGAFNAYARLNWVSTVRARAGFSTGPLFIYATGGLAFGGTRMGLNGRVDETYTENVTIDNNSVVIAQQNGALPQFSRTTVTTWSASRNRTSVGWALGAGAEWAINDNWSFKGEYVYYNLGTKRLTAQGISTTTGTDGLGAILPTTRSASSISIRQKFDGHIFRVGLNYRFFSPAPYVMAPVVARY
jgi:opacity protein-like surface antigen